MEPAGVYTAHPSPCSISQDVALSEIQLRISRQIIAAAIADLEKWQQCLTPEQRQQLRELGELPQE